jgi:cytochrome c biogenesis protein CcdA
MSGGVDTTVIAAFAVGFVSFISPCVLPLVPGYLSAVSGITVAEMKTGERSLSRILFPAIVFCLSFTVVFVALGMTATGLGSTLNDSRGTLDKVAGAVIIALGLFFLLTPFVPKLNREWRPDALIARAGSGGPLVAGAAFAVAWTPCVGPMHGVQAKAKAAPAISGPPEPARRISASGRHSRLSRGTKGVSRKKTPMATISAPATLSSVARLSLRACPRPVAVIPSATNMTVNDRQKMAAGHSTLARVWLRSRSSAIETPLTADR